MRTLSTPPPQAVLPQPSKPLGLAQLFAGPWEDVSLRAKMTLVILLAATGGAVVGAWQAYRGDPFALSVGLAVIVAAVLVLARFWVWGPLERLCRQLGRISREERPPGLDELPTHRGDEVGELARSIQTLNGWCIRDSLEVRQLRRTLDHRVTEATQRATRQLQRLAMHDPLTDLGNRRFLEEHLEALVKSVLEAEDAATDLACFAIDIDRFKQVNDVLGHAAGDELIVFVANLIHASVRREDLAARVGGDEFVILIPGCAGERASQFARQLVALFRQHARTLLPPDCPASLSIGVASLRASGVKTGRELLERADACLYEAKRAGRDRVVGTGE